MSDKKIKITVVILTYNGEEYLDEVLQSVLRQRVSFEFAVLVIDSGSKDKTLNIIDKYNRVFKSGGTEFRLIKIKNEDFGHGKTRNMAIKESESEYVVLITQDATPASETWLSELIAPYGKDKKIVATFGPHLARKNCNPVIERDMENHFKNFGTEDKPVVQSIKKEEEIDGIIGFFSDVNASIRKSFWEKHPYKEVSYAEDQIMGREILASGYKKAYCPKASVFHSHTYPTREYLGRYFDEYRGLKESIGFVDENVTFLKIIPNAIINFFRDAKYIKSQKYSKKELIKYFWQAFLMNLYRQIAAYLGGRYEKIPKSLISKISLELSKKRRANV